MKVESELKIFERMNERLSRIVRDLAKARECRPGIPILIGLDGCALEIVPRRDWIRLVAGHLRGRLAGSNHPEPSGLYTT